MNHVSILIGAKRPNFIDNIQSVLGSLQLPI